MYWTKKATFLILTMSLLFILAACGGNDETPDTTEEVGSNEEVAASTNDEEAVNSEKTELNMALSVDPDGLDPHATTAASTFQITNNIFDTLIKVSPDGELLSGLAESWEISEDGLTATFNLRKDVSFHNGDEFTASDVEFSFNRLKSEESPRAADYAYISKINVIDDYTIEFTASELSSAFETDFAYPWAAIVSEDATDDIRNAPVGTGPYKLEEWVAQQNITVTKNENYHDPAIIETVNFSMMPDVTARSSAMQSGELDLVNVTGDIVPQFEGNEAFNVIENQANSVQLMAMNLDNEFLQDESVRQAINLAVDKESLIESVWWGFGDEIGSHYPLVLNGYTDTTDRYEYNPEEARNILAEAGYEENEVTLDMYLPSDYQQYVDAGQVVADSLQEVGININIEIVEWAVWLSDVYTDRNYDLTVVGHTGRLDPYVLLSRYHTDSSENYFNYSNDRVDEILSSAQTELNEDKRMELYGEMQEILAEEVPALYIQAPITLFVSSSDLRGFESYPIDIYELKDVYFVEE